MLDPPLLSHQLCTSYFMSRRLSRIRSYLEACNNQQHMPHLLVVETSLIPISPLESISTFAGTLILLSSPKQVHILLIGSPDRSKIVIQFILIQ